MLKVGGIKIENAVGHQFFYRWKRKKIQQEFLWGSSHRIEVTLVPIGCRVSIYKVSGSSILEVLKSWGLKILLWARVQLNYIPDLTPCHIWIIWILFHIPKSNWETHISNRYSLYLLISVHSGPSVMIMPYLIGFDHMCQFNLDPKGSKCFFPLLLCLIIMCYCVSHIYEKAKFRELFASFV